MTAALTPPEHMASERLRFRALTDADAAFVFSYARDPEITRYLSFPTHTDIGESEGFIQRCQDFWKEGLAFTWLLEVVDGSPVGVIDLRPHGHWAETGYVVARPFWGRGFMTEAVETLMAWTLNQDGIYRFAAYCDAENHGSRRVLEKAGMNLEGTLRRFGVHPNLSAQPRDCQIFARVR